MNFDFNSVISLVGTTGTIIAALAIINSIIVEVLKKVFIKAPTQLVAWISALIITLAFFLITGDYSTAQTIITTIIRGILSGFIVALISTEGYDGLKKLITRLSSSKED